MAIIRKFLEDLFEDAIEGVKQEVTASVHEIGNQIRRQVQIIKRSIMLSIVQAVFVLSGLILLIAGILVFISRFASWDLILIIAGLILLYGAIIVSLMNRR